MNPLSLSFQERLGKQVIIKKNIKSDKLIRKQRYLNSISNKKKLINFNKNPNITDLEQIRLLYNESVSLFNQNAEIHNNPIRRNKRIEKYKTKKEEKLNQIIEKKNKFYLLTCV